MHKIMIKDKQKKIKKLIINSSGVFYRFVLLLGLLLNIFKRKIFHTERVNFELL